jgi:hypothetical protein
VPFANLAELVRFLLVLVYSSSVTLSSTDFRQA